MNKKFYTSFYNNISVGYIIAITILTIIFASFSIVGMMIWLTGEMAARQGYHACSIFFMIDTLMSIMMGYPHIVASLQHDGHIISHPENIATIDDAQRYLYYTYGVCHAQMLVSCHGDALTALKAQLDPDHHNTTYDLFL